jgi:hypothetical protein
MLSKYPETILLLGLGITVQLDPVYCYKKHNLRAVNKKNTFFSGKNMHCCNTVALNKKPAPFTKKDALLILVMYYLKAESVIAPPPPIPTMLIRSPTIS